MIPACCKSMTRDFNEPHLEQDISIRDKKQLKKGCKGNQKNIDCKALNKNDKDTPDKATNMPVATKRIRFVMDYWPKTIKISKIMATNLLRGSNDEQSNGLRM